MPNILYLCAKDKKEKISIFRNLFKGREDVFAKYWVSRKSGKKGYSPVCKNEWIPQICRKPCEKCENKEYVSLDDFSIEKHLRGDIIIGIYPIQLDDRVNFLALSKVYDYYDQYVSVLNIMFQKRKRIYEKLGIKQAKPDNKV